jgi:hypothetical protein
MPRSPQTVPSLKVNYTAIIMDEKYRRDCYSNFNEAEELAELNSIKGSISGVELRLQVVGVIHKFSLNTNKLRGIKTDGKLIMTGRKRTDCINCLTLQLPTLL